MQAQKVQRSAALDVLQAVNILLGIWVIGSTYWLGVGLYKGARISNGLAGAAIIGATLCVLTLPAHWRWVSIFGVLAGLYTIAAPFLTGFAEHQAGMISNVVVGILITLIAAVGLVRR